MAECEGRQWIAFDKRLDYLAASSFRFFADAATDAELKSAHDAILQGKAADLRHDVFQAVQPMLRKGHVHRPSTPSQGLLVLSETSGAPNEGGRRLSKRVTYVKRAGG